MLITALRDLPCPFCGSLDSFVERMAFTSAYVICNSCGAHGPISEQDGDNEDVPGEAAARHAWNNRTQDEREDMAYANGVSACLARLYAAGARDDAHNQAWEDCERMGSERTKAVIDARAHRRAHPQKSRAAREHKM